MMIIKEKDDRQGLYGVIKFGAGDVHILTFNC